MLREFFRATFLDVNGNPSAQLATAFAVSAGIAAVLPFGLLTGRWPPDGILSMLLLFNAALLGLDTYTTARKITADSPPSATVTADTINVNQAPANDPPLQ